MPEQEVVTRHTVKTLLERDDYRSRLNNLLGARAPQFAMSLIAISQDWKMEKCEPGSVIAAGMIAATLDLPINPQLGFAFIIPYGSKATFQMGYKGYVQLAMRSGLYRRLNVTEVYDGELMKYDRVKADVVIDETKRKKPDVVIGYLAYFELTNGAEHALYWTKEAVEKHAARYSQSYIAKKHDSPWFTDFDKQGCKTVLKSLLTHWGPLSVQMQTAVVSDIDDDALPTVVVEPAVEPKVRRKRLKESPETASENAPASNAPAKAQDAGGVSEERLSPGELRTAAATRTIQYDSPIKESPKEDALNMLIKAKVPYDDFSDFILNQGIYRDIKNFPGYEDVPLFVWDTLAKMPTAIQKIIKLYGKVQSVAS